MPCPETAHTGLLFFGSVTQVLASEAERFLDLKVGVVIGMIGLEVEGLVAVHPRSPMYNVVPSLGNR